MAPLTLATIVTDSDQAVLGTSVPAWIIAGVLILLAGMIFWLPIFSPKQDGKERTSWLSAVGSARTPLMLLVFLLLAHTFLQMTHLVESGWYWAWYAFFKVASVVLITLSVFYLIEGIERVIMARYDVSQPDNLRARRLHTQVRVLSRTVQVALIVIGLGVLLMSFDWGRQFGASLLASAGIASLAIGLAARPTLENLIAGIQLALTQPIRLDDVVIVEGEWGRVEEITTTYVVIKIWDERRMVVPLRYFIENSFQNWTRTSAQLLGTVFIRCDFRVDVDEIRDELKRLCGDHEAWDERVAAVQVTDASEKAVELRALVSASNSSLLWDLRVYIREGLLRYLRDAAPDAMPHSRAIVDFDDLPGEDMGESIGESS